MTINLNLELNTNLKGKCLVAMPSIQNNVFEQSIVYITEHSIITGAVGVIMNKSMTNKINLSCFDFDEQPSKNWQSLPLFFGGPVELETGFIVHNSSDDDRWVLTGGKQKIQQLFTNSKINPIMLTAGYCMWESFQLEREMRFNNWLVFDNPDSLTNIEPEQRYNVALDLLGISNLANFDFSGGGNA
ncbi:MAG: hypothetical protein RLZZ293_147 [Pseudomonadota bacterium]|jgi:putative transcriptional regulator